MNELSNIEGLICKIVQHPEYTSGGLVFLCFIAIVAGFLVPIKNKKI